MAKAGLLEQNRLSGANRNTLIAGGIMANTAEIFNFPVPDAAQKEPRVADLDDGYTRIANELLEAVMLAGLTQHQLLVFLAVMRKTYGFNKKTGLGEQRATFRIDRDIAAQVFCCKKRSGKAWDSYSERAEYRHQ